MKIIVEERDFIKKVELVIPDSDIPKFFKRATGRKYTNRETCVNDIRRMLMLFWNERMRKQEATNES
jgi:hypothetical protein